MIKFIHLNNVHAIKCSIQSIYYHTLFIIFNLLLFLSFICIYYLNIIILLILFVLSFFSPVFIFVFCYLFMILVFVLFCIYYKRGFLVCFLFSEPCESAGVNSTEFSFEYAKYTFYLVSKTIYCFSEYGFTV